MARKAKTVRSRKAATRNLQAEVHVLGKKLEALVVDVRKAEVSTRARMLAQLRELQRRQAAAQRTLAKLGRQSVAATGPIVAGLQKAWREIESGVRQGAKRFQRTG